jgi:16S rRNA (adenine1518-N6/adenine1519-N6)-dimethyltransferase
VTLSAAQVRDLAQRLEVRPTKKLGQNFVIDPNTVRRIVALAGPGAHDTVLEIGPGLGSLTLGLLDAAGAVVAVEIDAVLARALPETVAERDPRAAERLTVLNADALELIRADLPSAPTALVANLPYNVSVPVVLHVLGEFGSIESGLVMVQKEVGERLSAPPGSRTYGIPSAKLAWYCHARTAGSVSRTVFWPVPNVDSVLVALQRRPPPVSTAGRRAVFAVIDAAFSQRRKMLRSALAGWAGSAARAEQILLRAGVDPALRGEVLALEQFVAIADAGA